MSNWARRRQITYLVGGIIFLGLIFLGSYLLFSPSSNCFDGKQNGDEVGVDCGGSCAKACSAQVEDLRMLWARGFQGSPSQAYAMAVLENRNNGIALRRLDYIFRIFDAQNFLIAEKTGQTYVNPREKFVIFEGGVNTGSQTATRAELEFTNHSGWESFSPIAKPVIAVEQEFLELSPQTRLGVLITNTSVYDLRDVTIPVLLYDERGNVMAGSSTYIENLPRGASKQSIYLWPSETLNRPTSIEFYPRVNLFDIR